MSRETDSSIKALAKLNPDGDELIEITENAVSGNGEIPTGQEETSGVNPDLLAIRSVNDRINGKNSWSEGFPSSLQYPNGVTINDVLALDHLGIFRLQAALAQRSTVEVTSDILNQVSPPTQDPS